MMPGRLMKCGVRSFDAALDAQTLEVFLEDLLAAPLGTDRGVLEREEALERQLTVLHR